MRRQLRAAGAAVAFLTRLPVAGRITFDGDDVSRAGPFFPLVGAAIGGGTAALASRLPQPLGAAVGFTSATVVTGALHLDALADTADATGARSSERAFEIMRDSRSGAFGVTAITCDALVKTLAIASLAQRDQAVRAGLAAGALSRAVPVALAAALPYARTGGGTGEAIAGGGGLAAATAVTAAVAVTVAATGVDGFRLAAAACASAALFGAVYARWLGGVTGDTLGAATELTETLVLLLASALEER
jgi:adenosylcobinamide-GDP ribazoletransferase